MSDLLRLARSLRCDATDPQRTYSHRLRVGFAIAALVCFAAGAVIFAAGPFIAVGAPIGALMLAGLGLMAGASSIGAVTTLVTIAFVNGLVWYGRLHMRLLKPALEPTGVSS